MILTTLGLAERCGSHESNGFWARVWAVGQTASHETRAAARANQASPPEFVGSPGEIGKGVATPRQAARARSPRPSAHFWAPAALTRLILGGTRFPALALVVQKFGGTSVANLERMRRVAELGLRAQREGHQVVMIVSAMSGETNRLLGLAHEISPTPDMRELDSLASTGE